MVILLSPGFKYGSVEIGPKIYTEEEKLTRWASSIALESIPSSMSEAARDHGLEYLQLLRISSFARKN